MWGMACRKGSAHSTSLSPWKNTHHSSQDRNEENKTCVQERNWWPRSKGFKGPVETNTFFQRQRLSVKIKALSKLRRHSEGWLMAPLLCADLETILQKSLCWLELYLSVPLPSCQQKVPFGGVLWEPWGWRCPPWFYHGPPFARGSLVYFTNGLHHG